MAANSKARGGAPVSSRRYSTSANADAISRIRDAGRRGNLTLYLGAGVSVGNGLPTWEQLVLAMYYTALSEQSMRGWRPYSNYLFAIAEWHLQQSHEPLEIIARKVRKYYPDQDGFLQELRRTLYEGVMILEGGDYQDIGPKAMRTANSTLDSVVRLCEWQYAHKHCVRSVITYNYDALLEMSLTARHHESIFREAKLEADRLPIYHVHGYVPVRGAGSAGSDLVFTEDQYHLTAQNPYLWSNLVQIQAMSGSVGLMIGLSLADRNMRRLLDAVQHAPIEAENYALLQKPRWETPRDEVLDEIHRTAIRYFDRFEKSGVKLDARSRETVLRPGVKSSGPFESEIGAGVKGPRYQFEIRGILENVRRFDEAEQNYVLEQLGVCPIWYDSHEEIPEIIGKLVGQGRRLANRTKRVS